MTDGFASDSYAAWEADMAGALAGRAAEADRTVAEQVQAEALQAQAEAEAGTEWEAEL